MIPFLRLVGRHNKKIELAKNIRGLLDLSEVFKAAGAIKHDGEILDQLEEFKSSGGDIEVSVQFKSRVKTSE